MWIKAKNGNVVEVDDADHARRALKDGHEVFTSDPRVKGSKPKQWDPDSDDVTDVDDEPESDSE